jgi:lysophospholipase L1-like esterase
MSYEAIVGRRLNINFVNLGFSGSGKYKHALAKAVSAIDASCYVFDGTNLHTADSMRKVFPQFIETIRAKDPRTPILVISPIFSSYELINRRAELNNRGKRIFMQRVVGKFIANGDKNIQFFEGTDLLGPLQSDGLTDGVHPNDLGMEWISDCITRHLKRNNDTTMQVRMGIGHLF